MPPPLPTKLVVPLRGCASGRSSSLRAGRRFVARPAAAHRARWFGSTGRRDVVKPFLLADIGEGIAECQIIQWFVQPGARVEQFDKICEVQSDKASVEITSRFDGIVKRLHYDKDDVARVGKPLLDIDVQGEAGEEGAEEAGGEGPPGGEKRPPVLLPLQEKTALPEGRARGGDGGLERARVAALATPAVRRISKELNVDVADVQGSGKDGRVLKEDVQRFASGRQQQQQEQQPAPSIPPVLGEDKTIPLTGVQSAMFKRMTQSLSIPHLLYSDTVDLASLNAMRKKLNARSPSSSSQNQLQQQQQTPKLSSLPFILKAVSQALTQFPTLNAHLDAASPSSPGRPDEAKPPSLTLKAAHDIGIAVDSPAGLVVPVIRAVQNHSIASLGAEIARLSSLAHAGRLAAGDLLGASFTVSNVGSIGGAVVAPVISSPQVAVLGVGRCRAVPAFGPAGELVRRDECVLSWSADHRVVDGATVARCAELVRARLEGVEGMVVEMR